MVRRAANIVDHAKHSAPLKSDTVLRIEQLEHIEAEWELRKRWAAGAPAAQAILIERAAEFELLIERAQATCAAVEAKITGHAPPDGAGADDKE